MAVACFPSPAIPVQRSGQVVRPVGKRMMLKHRQITVKKAAPALLIRSSFKNKIFENKSEGIVCYVDESGEIICEGYDEGPRFRQQFTRKAYDSRAPEIISLLQQRLLEIVNGGGGEYSSAADSNVVPVKEDFS